MVLNMLSMSYVTMSVIIYKRSCMSRKSVTIEVEKERVEGVLSSHQAEGIPRFENRETWHAASYF